VPPRTGVKRAKGTPQRALFEKPRGETRGTPGVEPICPKRRTWGPLKGHKHDGLTDAPGNTQGVSRRPVKRGQCPG